MFYFLDAAKVFALVELDFLFEVLRKMGFGPVFLGWIRMIYSKQIANIWMEGYKSEQIDI